MSGETIRKEFLRKLAQRLLVLLLACGGSLILPQGAVAQQNSPVAFPPALIQSWKDYLKGYPAVLAQFQKEQEKIRQAAKPVMASGEKNLDNLMKTYPFLRKDLQSVKDLQQKVADYMVKHPSPSLKQSIDPTPHIQIAEDKDSRTGVNIFFVGNSGRLWCSPHGCSMDVYVDTGTGYQPAGSFMVTQSVYLARVDGNVFLFAGPPKNPHVVAWILKDHKFVITTPPPPEPQSQAFVEWRSEQEQAGKWPPK